MEKRSIKDYLHLYLGCDCIINWPNPDYEENGKVRKLDPLRIYEMLTEYPEASCKPILRKLDSIKEGELQQMEYDVFGISDAIGLLTVEDWMKTFYGNDVDDRHTFRNSVKFINWLREHGFDCDDLLPSNLAIDKNK